MVELSMTHAEVVERARKWLASRYPVVITELIAWGSAEEPDAIGFDYHTSTLIECKATRSDFLSDKKKKFRRHSDRGMGGYRYYMCPNGLIRKDEVPDGWGLLYIKGSRVYKQITPYKPFEQNNTSFRSEQRLLVSVIRRELNAGIKYFEIDSPGKATLTINKNIGDQNG